MSGAELGLGIVGVLQVVYACGKEFILTCQAFKQADTRLTETVVRVEACWVRVETQLQIVEKLAPILDERHRDVQQRVIVVLLGKLRDAISKVSSLKKNASPHWIPKKIEAKRFKFALARDSLAGAVSDIEAWSGVFDPTWYLMMSVANPEIDKLLSEIMKQQTKEQKEAGVPLPLAKYLRRALVTTTESSKSIIFLAEDGLLAGSTHLLPFSSASLAQRADTGAQVLLDPVTCAAPPFQQSVVKDVRNFARRLQRSDPFTFGLMECKGVVAHAEDPSSADPHAAHGFSFVFRFPTGYTAVDSVRGRLLRGDGSRHESLSGRFALARELVRAVSYVHIYGFVHKNIRPENILVLKWQGSEAGIEEGGRPGEVAVLVGFDILRDADGKTNRIGDDDWEKNLYRHPSRQGKEPKVDYEMRHDIYSLGVCLLEIGLWDTFVHKETGSEAGTLGSAVGYGADITGPELFKDPREVERRLLGLARGDLRRQMGSRYSKVVETCLTCLEEDNPDFGDEEEFKDEDGIAVGVRYVEKVVARLGEIVV